MRKSTKICAALGVVAGLGVAIAPLSAFADGTGTRTDTLNVTVGTACTLNGVAAATADDIANRYDATVEPGRTAPFQLYAAEGTTTTENKYTIVCNDATGYKIVGNGGNLTHTEDNTFHIEPGEVTAGVSHWDAQITGEGNLTAVSNTYMTVGSNTVVARNTGVSADGGDSFSVAYRVSAAQNLKAGLYTGTVTYTLQQGAN